jgi:hypothetical protein
MFLQEIENAETMKNHWFQRIFFRKITLHLPDPQSLNRFISSIMDPFKDKEQQEDLKREWEEKKQKEERRRETRKLLCWPFFYTIGINEKKEKEKTPDHRSNQKTPSRKSSFYDLKYPSFMKSFQVNEMVEVKTDFYDDQKKEYLWCDAEIKDMNLQDKTILIKYCDSNVTTIIQEDPEQIRKKKVRIKKSSESLSKSLENVVLTIQHEDSLGEEKIDAEDMV